MDRCTGVIINTAKETKCILCDDLSLFSSSSRLEDLIPEDSSRIEAFFTYLEAEKEAFNQRAEVIRKQNPVQVFLSGIYWMDYFIICISEEEIQSIVPFKEIIDDDSNILLNGQSEKSKEIDELNEINRLNNELINIQRELTQKNMNLSSLIERLEVLATTDPLTGIFNRRAILERAETEITRASRERRAYGLAILDLDDFKKINDQFGHQMGDDALKITSACLRESTRHYDAAGRIGGDEFLVFFSVDSMEQFTKILTRLLDEINQRHMDISGELKIRIKASIGAVYVDSKKHNHVMIEKLMKKADDALYNAKDIGGNNIWIEEF
jgi:diguanylate cyclase (GGDEF)-like protein